MPQILKINILFISLRYFLYRKVDYFSAFMKAWIAFNAWYNFSGEVPTGNDKACIEYIASQTNRFKTYMMNLINAENTEGSAYRENIAKLHGSLLNAAITNNLTSFHAIFFTSPI